MYLSPIQGHTDAAYRHFHAQHYKSPVIYTTPFIRLEKGEIRKKDLKDAFNPLNEGIEVIPQVIFKNEEELLKLVDIMKENGATSIDINMGCPFPLQTARGRGAATIANSECADAVKRVVTENPEINFSVKMRLGMKQEEWKDLINVLNEVKLDHISVHPRLASDQYTPDTINMESFKKIYQCSKNPIVYNGDIHSPEDARKLMSQFPELKGIMIGRGALNRPSIFMEIADGKDLDEKLRLQEMKRFHQSLFSHYKETLIGGDHQVLSKILPFWEYAESEIGRKAWKAIKKASSMAKYQTALMLINN